jgi:hypothetical protein
MNELAEAKRRLYGLLLQKKDMTDNEVNIAYYLACDEDIQKIIIESLKEKIQYLENIIEEMKDE